MTTRIRIPLTLATLFFALLLGTRSNGQVVQLGNGQVLLARVVDATTEGLTIRRLDTGGLLELEWSDLSKLHQEQIKERFGLSSGDDSEVMVEARAVYYRLPSGSIGELVGVIVDENDDAIIVERRGARTPVQRSVFDRSVQVQVPWDEIYTAETWYQKQVEALAPGEDADAHVRLAEELRRARLFEQAKVHLEKAVELGGGRHAVQLPQKLKSIDVLIESAEENALIAEIRRQRNRGRFGVAQELIVEFEQRFPESKIVSELDKEKGRLATAMEDETGKEVRIRYPRAMREVAYELAGQELTWEQARDLAGTDMGRLIFEQIAKELQRRMKGVEITPEEVEALWARRAEFSVRPYSQFLSYDLGSWVLGEQAIIKDTHLDGAATAGQPQAGGGDDPDLERFIRRLRDVQRRGRSTGGGRGGQQKEVTEQDWWASISRQQKQSWLQAYYAENGGHLTLKRAAVDACPTCSARGFLIDINSTGGQGGQQRRQCPTCHGTKYLRIVRVQ